MAPPQWAYQVENYMTPPDEELVCSICRAVFCEPALCPCDHIFCKVCITKWLQNSRNCPICRKRVALASIKPPVPIVKNLIMKYKVYCRNKTLGCSSYFTVEGSETHVKECEYELVQCKNKPCTDKMFRKDIAEHETKDCPHRAIRCKKCKCKIPTSSETVEHDCINALRGLLKERSEMVLAKSARIKQLKAELKQLKARMKETDQSRQSNFPYGRSLNSDTLSSISPDEIIFNLRELDSASSSSIPDISSDDDSIIIFTNESLPNDNEEYDSFSVSMDNDDNIENGSSHGGNAYRNAESQTVDFAALVNAVQNVATQDPSLLGDARMFREPFSADHDFGLPSGSRRPAKRRRRFPPQTLGSNDEDVSHWPSSSRSPVGFWRSMMLNPDECIPFEPLEASTSSASIQADLSDPLVPKKQSYMKAGPSSSVQSDRPNHLISKKQSSNMEAGPSSASVQSDLPDHSSSKKQSHARQKQAKQTGKFFRDNTVSSRITSDNPIFERTLSLLEQHSLESDPEWLPDHAGQRESDTTETDSSYVVESSDSDVDSVGNKSVNLDDSFLEHPAISDLMNWMFESTSEEDPDWRPPYSDDDSM